VESAARTKKLPATILNPASIMGPGDPNINSPHNQLYKAIYKKFFFGSFSGGLAIVDVRDLTAIILKSLKKEARGEKYLIVGANTTYQEILKAIGKYAGQKVYPVRLPAFLLTAGGLILEMISVFSGRRPLLTQAYGKLSGWYTYYSNEKSRNAFSHEYINLEKTIQDSCIYFKKTFM
jgi:nucleoside-diphosphate-sugar epimerase